MLDIHLYLGAHKTATTHLQGILMASRDLLSAQNIKLSAPQDVRKEWLPKLFKYCNNPNERGSGLLEGLRAIAPKDGLWILTEENIAGVSNDFVIKPGMYPAAAERIKSIVEIFPDANISLFFSLRSYDSFYRSAYSEVVRNRGYLPFGEFYDEARFAGNSWAEMVSRFQSVLPQQNITLWRFEDFRSLVPQLVRGLTNIQEVEALLAAYKPETTRPSLSQKTIDILAQLHPVLNRQESLALVERINRAYPISDECSPCRPFSEQQEAVFRQKYVEDIQAIKAGFPEINFLQP